MTAEYYFVQPVDTVSIRGNKLFGEPGSVGESSFPPLPSVLAGAFRSQLLTRAADEITSFSQGTRLSDETLHSVLGTPKAPGSFVVSNLFPARLASEVELFMPLPADVKVVDEGNTVCLLEPQALSAGIKTNQDYELPMVPVLRQDRQAKSEGGWLLNQQGIQAYFSGEVLNSSYLQRHGDLWRHELRVGIALSASSRTADEGHLFAVEHTVPFQPEHNRPGTTGLLVGLQGCGSMFGDDGFIRLGGDGRAAYFRAVDVSMPQPPWDQIGKQGSFKMLLHTPALFKQGWLPDMVTKQDNAYYLQLENFSARLCCAAVPRYEVISGWDLAKWRPKPAERAVPAGSVYWFDKMQGDPSVLDKLVSNGFWMEDNYNTAQRRAEGFNRVQFACWAG